VAFTASLTTPTSNPSFDPIASNPTLPTSVATLPPPSISPPGGTFEAMRFPSVATIAKNITGNIPARAVYMIIHSDNTYTSWATYSGALSLDYGDTVLAYNQSTDTNRYSDSVQVSQLFIREPKPLPTPILNPPGGTFDYYDFPIRVTISSNGAPGGSFSKLRYRITSSSGSVGSWQTYSSPVSMAGDETLEARNFGVDTTSYYDSDSAMGTYTQDLTDVPFFAGTVEARWKDLKGLSSLLGLVNNLFLDDVTAEFGKGLPGSAANKLEFKRIPFDHVVPDTYFKLGRFSYFNGTVQSGTEASSVKLDLQMNFNKPVTQNGKGTANISLWSSANTGSESRSADYAQLDNPITDVKLNFKGQKYVLELKFANISAEEGWTDGTKLYVYEGSNGTADLIGRLVTQ
jgi:hypothetical protein